MHGDISISFGQVGMIGVRVVFNAAAAISKVTIAAVHAIAVVHMSHGLFMLQSCRKSRKSLCGIA